MKTLRDAEIGATVKVLKLHGEGAVKRRIMEKLLIGLFLCDLHATLKIPITTNTHLKTTVV